MKPHDALTRAAPVALVALFLLVAPLPVGAWSEFGEKEETEMVGGPEIREPFFEFLISMAESYSIGL